MNKEKSSKKFVIIATVAGLIIVGYGLLVYLFIFPSRDKIKSADTLIAITQFDPSKVRLDVESGAVSTDKFLTLTLKLAGLENKETAEKLSKDNNLKLEINQSQAEITETQISGEDALLIRAKIPLNEESYNNFSGGKSQNLEVRVDLQYETERMATRALFTSFNKKDSSSSLGQEIALGNATGQNTRVTKEGAKESSVAPPSTSKIASQKPINPNKDVSITITRNEAPSSNQRSSAPSRSNMTNISRPSPSEDTDDVIRDLKRNKIINKSVSNN